MKNIVFNPINSFNETNTTPIGESDVNKRVCRFCGRGVKQGATFNHKSHAISECLGNKNIFTYEECDSCNQEFSRLEQNIGNFFAGQLYLYGVNGKSSHKNPLGLRRISTPECDFSEKSGVKVVTVKGKNSNSILGSLTNNSELNLQSTMKFDKYCPLDVYKSFCKFALSLFNIDDFSHFKKLTEWVVGKRDLLINPVVLYSQCAMPNIQPKFIYFTQNDSNQAPYCVGLFFICHLVFIVEFPSDETFEYQSNEIRLQLLRFLSVKIFQRTDFRELPLYGTELIPTIFKFSINIPQNLKEGKDFFVGRTKDEVEELMSRFNLK